MNKENLTANQDEQGEGCDDSEIVLSADLVSRSMLFKAAKRNVFSSIDKIRVV